MSCTGTSNSPRIPPSNRNRDKFQQGGLLRFKLGPSVNLSFSIFQEIGG